MLSDTHEARHLSCELLIFPSSCSAVGSNESWPGAFAHGRINTTDSNLLMRVDAMR